MRTKPKANFMCLQRTQTNRTHTLGRTRTKQNLSSDGSFQFLQKRAGYDDAEK